jgi:NitT/TauT family transport system permease protein
MAWSSADSLKRRTELLLGATPFVALLLVYVWTSGVRLSVNPNDKLLPSLRGMLDGLLRVGFETDVASGHYIIVADTLASLTRLGTGLGLAALIGLVLGVLIGVFSYVRAVLGPFVATLSIIPPLTLLPVLLIAFGLGEPAKINLMIIGLAPFLVRDTAARVQEIPRELLIKAKTLDASRWVSISHVILPHALPRLLDSVRLSLGPAWLYLISSEAIAATTGLGYRIFLVRRYMSMDVIFPYVAWIAILAFTVDLLLRRISRLLFPWRHR